MADPKPYDPKSDGPKDYDPKHAKDTNDNATEVIRLPKPWEKK